MIHFVIPARAGSKGLPEKNRKLFQFTAMTIPPWKSESVFVSSDDEYVLSMAKDRGFIPYRRPDELGSDEASMKPVLIDLAKYYGWDSSDWVVMLYLTYPERTWQEIEAALQHFSANCAKSLLCRKEWTAAHPALCLWHDGIHHGKQLFPHDLYRRQDYPPVFEISHYIFISRVDELEKLNRNLYNEETFFFPISPGTIDVDTQSDLKDFVNKTKQMEE